MNSIRIHEFEIPVSSETLAAYETASTALDEALGTAVNALKESKAAAKAAYDERLSRLAGLGLDNGEQEALRLLWHERYLAQRDTAERVENSLCSTAYREFFRALINTDLDWNEVQAVVWAHSPTFNWHTILDRYPELATSHPVSVGQ
jgi:hypothetical protein